MGPHTLELDDLPTEEVALADLVTASRRNIEPWLSAVFQSEHLNLVLGSGFTSAISYAAGAKALGMSKVTLDTPDAAAIDAHAKASAARMSRGEPNFEDQLRSALQVLRGLEVTDPGGAAQLKTAIDAQLKTFLESLLATERALVEADVEKRNRAEAYLQSFLLSHASRAASRERLHIFTTNYDRLIEHGCDLAGLRIVDRFVGGLTPFFRSSRIEVDLHYNPPGIRGEPRFMEGVLRLSKIHGSLDWKYDTTVGVVRRLAIPFGAGRDHSGIPNNPVDTVMIYPNPAKDVETTAYPYAELFRDMAAALCRPNAVVVTYGYGFGDDHINRVLIDMLSIPSTHLVIIAFEADDRVKAFCARTRSAQVSLLVGSHFGALDNLVEHYLPKPALDYITGRLTDLMRRRPEVSPSSKAASDATPDINGLT